MKKYSQEKYFNRYDVLALTQKTLLQKIFENLRKSLVGERTSTKILGQDLLPWKSKEDQGDWNLILKKGRAGDRIREEGRNQLGEGHVEY